MTEKMWNVATRGAMFKMLRRIEINGKRVGMYYVSFKKGCDRFSKEEKDQILEMLYEKMIADGYLDRERSKSSSGLKTQLVLCLGYGAAKTDTFIDGQYKKGFNPNHTNQLRMIAYAAGWMRMIDIIELETLTVEATQKESQGKPMGFQRCDESKLKPTIIKIRDFWNNLENPPLAINELDYQWIYCGLGPKPLHYHYEFLVYGKAVGIEFHIESTLRRGGSILPETLLPELEAAMGTAITIKTYKTQIKFIAKTLPITDDVEPIVQEMISFMNKTKHIFEEKLALVKK